MGGTIPKAREKEYTAQEHATPECERKILDKLLLDATEHLFDAVIVANVSRWARDNLKSEMGLKVLRENDILFYVGSMEFELHNPLHHCMLSNSVSLVELYAEVMTPRALDSKIKRSKEGRPSVGNLPFGRAYDKKTGKWGVDERFLGGATKTALEKETGFSALQLYKLFSGAAGDA